MESKVGEFTRVIEFTPAYDRRNSDPKRNYGVHGVDLRFLLKGSNGAIQFLLFTGWHLPHVREEHKQRDASAYRLGFPIAADLGYHSFVPRYAGQEPMTEDCPVLDGKRCYCDGSGLQAEPVFDILVEQGEEKMWEKLQEEYEFRLGENAK